VGFMHRTLPCFRMLSRDGTPDIRPPTLGIRRRHPRNLFLALNAERPPVRVGAVPSYP